MVIVVVVVVVVVIVVVARELLLLLLLLIYSKLKISCGLARSGSSDCRKRHIACGGAAGYGCTMGELGRAAPTPC